MGTFFISPEIFDLLTEKGQAQVTEMIDTAVKKGLMISPRGERLNGFGKVLLTVATMTPVEYAQYELSGGTWEFVSGVQWVCDRLLFEDYMTQASSGEGGVALSLSTALSRTRPTSSGPGPPTMRSRR